MPAQSPTLPDRLIVAGRDRARALRFRPGATRSRDLVYLATREGLAAAPLLGHGWPADPRGSDWVKRL